MNFSSDTVKRIIKVLACFLAIFAYNHIIPFKARDFVLGGAILFVGIYRLIVPFKKINGIRDDNLSAYSKAWGALALPIGISLICIAIHANTGIITNTHIWVLLLFTSVFSGTAMLVMHMLFKKRH